MRRLLKGLGIALAVLVVVVAAGLAALVWLVDPATWREELEARASDALGRQVSIEGEMDLEPGLPIALVLGEVEVANVAGGSRPHMATIDRLALAVPVRPLIGGEVRFEDIDAEGGDILLERGAEGRPNWRFEGDSDGDGGGMAWLERIDLAGVAVTWRPGEGVPRSATIDDGLIARADDGDGLAIDLTGSFEQRPAALRGNLGAPSEFGAGGGAWPLDLTADFGGARLAVAGTVDLAAEPAAMDLEFGVESLDPQPLADLIGRPVPIGHAVAISGRAHGTTEEVELAGLDGALGETGFGGTVTVVLSGPRPGLIGDLTVERLDLRDFRSRTRDDGAEARGTGIVPPVALPVDWLQAMDASLDLTIGALDLRAIVLDNASGSLSISDGQGTMRIAEAELWGGTVEGTVSADSWAEPPSFRVDGAVRHLALAAMVGPAAERRNLSGNADLAMTLSGAGADLAGVVATADGTVGLVSGQAQIESRYLDVIGRSVLTAVLPVDSASEGATQIECAVVRFDVTDGVGDSRALLLATPEVTIGGEARVDLPDGTLDIVLRPRAQNPEIAPLTVPARIYGPIGNPTVEAQPGELIGDAATGLLLGAINPLGLVVPLVTAGQTGDNPCIAALRGEDVGFDSGPGGPLGAATEGVGTVLEGVGEGLRELFGQ